MVQINHTAHVKKLIIYLKKKNADQKKIFCEPVHGIRRKEKEPGRRKGRWRQAQDTGGHLTCDSPAGPAAHQHQPTPGPGGAGTAFRTEPRGEGESGTAMAHGEGSGRDSQSPARPERGAGSSCCRRGDT